MCYMQTVQRRKSLQSTWNLSISLNQISDTILKHNTLNKFLLSLGELTIKDNYLLQKPQFELYIQLP